MATETVIVEINVQESLTQLATLNQELQELTKMREKLAEASKKGDLEATKLLEGLNSVIRQTQEEYRAQQRIVDGYVKSKKLEVDTTDFANNSINANRALLKQLTAQYNDLKSPSKEATDIIKRLSDTLKQQESAIGDNRRSVGSYRESIVAAFKDIQVFGVNISSVVDPLKNATNGFKAAGGGLAGLGASAGAIAAGGLPLLIAGFQGLVSTFQSYKPIADAVESATVQLGAAFSALVDGRSINDAASAARDLLETLRDLEDTQKSAALIQTEFGNEIDRLLLQSRNIAKSTDERLELLARASRLEQSNLEQTRSRLDEEIKARSDYFRRTFQLTEKEVFQGLFAGEQQEKQFRERLESFTGYKEEELNQLFDLINEREKLEGQSLALQDKIENRRNALLEKSQQERERLLDRQKAADEKARQVREAYLKNLEALETQFILNDRERLAKSFDDKLKTVIGQNTRETELRLAIEQEKALALEKFDADIETRRQERLAARLKQDLADQKAAFAILEQNAEQQLELQKLFNKSQEEIDAEFANSSYISFKEFYEAKKKLYQDDLNNQKSIAQQAKEAAKQAAEDLKNYINIAIQTAQTILGIVNSVNQAQQQAAEAEIERDRNTLETKQALLQEQYDNGLISKQRFDAENLKLEKAFNAKAAQIKKEQYEKDKKARIAAAVINTAAAVVSALGTSGNIIAGIILAALAAATGAAQIAIIASEPTPTFALGGDASGSILVGGRPHSQGGTTYRGSDGNVFEAERGEGIFVMKRDAYSELSKLSSWNEVFGGNSWFGKSVSYAADGGNVITDGGFVVRDIVNNLDNSILLQNAIKNGFSSAPRPIVSVQDIRSAEIDYNRSLEVADL